ncbi:MAG: hypothetical protein WCC41_15185 [Rhodomicrobium sp.]
MLNRWFGLHLLLRSRQFLDQPLMQKFGLGCALKGVRLAVNDARALRKAAAADRMFQEVSERGLFSTLKKEAGC